MNKRKAVKAFCIFLLIAIAAYYSLYLYNSISQRQTATAYAVKATPVTYENIENVLSGNSMVKILPENSEVLLKFYNFNTGSRVWEKSYVLKKGLVNEGTATNPDITLSMHSKYLDEMTDQNLCSIIKKAKSNNDLGVEMHIPYAALLWKYKNVLKYKDCFGL